ncbi:50S ribosomal protein L28 [Zostera marina]|uniref:Large ribosomal subunit protein bL28c n=1 Tax=Zostera marina TaxID=29655 RepID=A0A0K9PCD6_ZOSMR|nr:50S ribosomal protein L28 [Zostera marina]
MSGGVVACAAAMGCSYPPSSFLAFSAPRVSIARSNSVAKLGFASSSQFRGIKIAAPISPFAITTITSRPFQFQPVAKRICPLTGKKANRANKVSFSNHKTKKRQFVNLQYKRVWWEAGKRFIKLRISTKAMKTIEKNGLDAVAKKAEMDLRKK